MNIVVLARAHKHKVTPRGSAIGVLMCYVFDFAGFQLSYV